jgi:hypothetical protein
MAAPIHATDTNGRPYVRVRLKGRGVVWAAKGRRNLTPWAEGLHATTFAVLTRAGEPKDEIVIAGDADIVWEKPAQLNHHYGLLELAEKGV